LLKFGLGPNALVVPWANEVPKREFDVPKVEEPGVLNIEGVVLVNAGLCELNKDGVDEVEPNGLEEVKDGKEVNAGDETEGPKPELLKAGGFEAKGFEVEGEEKGFADDCPNKEVAPPAD
jgi:hypothetical protein